MLIIQNTLSLCHCVNITYRCWFNVSIEDLFSVCWLPSSVNKMVGSRSAIISLTHYCNVAESPPTFVSSDTGRGRVNPLHVCCHHCGVFYSMGRRHRNPWHQLVSRRQRWGSITQTGNITQEGCHNFASVLPQRFHSESSELNKGCSVFLCVLVVLPFLNQYV